jgi:subtilisin family serine protease
VTADGSNRLKPDIAAPGESILSSIPGGLYGFSSGTSMAAPHLAGAVALLLSADANFSGDVTGMEERFYQTALRLTTTETCGGIPALNFPNNTFGWGLLNAYAAVAGQLYFPIME